MKNSVPTMKSFYHIAASILLMFVLIAQGIAVNPPMNLVIGVGSPLVTTGEWANFSAINLISGSSILPITSANTVLYIGFTGGTFADINNMVLYTTKRESARITAVTSPSTISEKYSAGPNFSATSASGGANMATIRVETQPAKNEPSAAVASAGPARPRRAIW